MDPGQTDRPTITRETSSWSFVLRTSPKPPRTRIVRTSTSPVRAHFDQQPAAGAQPFRRMVDRLSEQPQPGGRVVREGLLGLECLDLPGEAAHLALRHVRRGDGEHVHGAAQLAGQRFEEVASAESRIGQAQALSVPPCLLDGFAGDVDTEHARGRHLGRNRQGDRPDPGGQVDVHRRPPTSEAADGLLGHELAGLPGDERAGSDLELQAEESRASREVRGRDAREAALEEALEPAAALRLERTGDIPGFELVHFEHERHQLLGVDALLAGMRVLDVVGGLQPLLGVVQLLLHGWHGV